MIKQKGKEWSRKSLKEDSREEGSKFGGTEMDFLDGGDAVRVALDQAEFSLLLHLVARRSLQQAVVTIQCHFCPSQLMALDLH